MRIIAGEARRTVLEVAANSPARPFLELARGALMNALGERLIGARALDLYAGSGALGLEALSRGAAFCRFVERDAAAFAALSRNVDKCRMRERAVLTRSDVERMLATENDVYDILFVDPPFPDLPEWREGGRAAGIMRGAARVLAPGGELVFRLEDGKVAPPEWPGLSLRSDRRYGRSRVCRYGEALSGRSEG